MSNQETIQIVVHPGVFHADDVLCVALIKKCNKDIEFEIERKRPTEEELNDGSILVFDVGGELNPEKGNFDHHQDRSLPAACELVFNRFKHMLGLPEEANKYLYDKLIKPVSDADCGKGEQGDLSLSLAIHMLNPRHDHQRDERFAKAVEVMSTLLDGFISEAINFTEDRKYVLETAYTICDGKVLVLDEFVQWNEHLFERSDEADILYVIYPSPRGGYCIQQVPIEVGSFEGRKPLPLEWAGKRGKELAEYIVDRYGEAYKVEASDSLFCHPGRFIGGASCENEAIKLADLAINS